MLIAFLLLGCQQNSKNSTTVISSKTKSDSITIGLIHVLHSKILNEDRELIISLPQEYHEHKSNYPVLYLLDGFQNIEHVRGSVEILTRTGNIPPLIIVGIKSVNRERDFTFEKSKKNSNSGGGKKFLKFIESELIPYVDSRYRTHPFRVLEGHSLGGLFAASTLLDRPNLFQGFIIMSPAFWWNNEALTAKAKPFFESHSNLEKSLFFGIGKKESTEAFGMRKELTNFIDVVKTSKSEKLYFEHREFDNEGHMSSPLLSNYYGLKFIFKDLNYLDSFKANFSEDLFIKKEKELEKKYGESTKRTGEAYYELGASIYKENLPGAIAVFKRSVEVYPYDLNLITTLAELYQINKDTLNTINTYEQAIEVSKKYNFGREKSFQKEIQRLKAKNSK